MCEAIISLTANAVIRHIAGEDPDGSAIRLYQTLEQTEFWTFSRMLRIGADIRKQIAIEQGLCACYIWPKGGIQFLYITRPRKLLDQGHVPGAEAIVGVFTIEAPQSGNACVQHGEAFYLLPGGALKSRSHWKSKYLGVNESEIVIHCHVEFDRTSDGREYAGLISLKRVREILVIGKYESGEHKVESVQAYRGEFGTLGETPTPDAGGIYCEELRHPVDPDGLPTIFEKVHLDLLTKVSAAPRATTIRDAAAK